MWVDALLVLQGVVSPVLCRWENGESELNTWKSDREKKQTLAMISVSLLRERENLRSSTQVRDTLYLATTKAGLNGSAIVPRWASLAKVRAFTASKRFL